MSSNSKKSETKKYNSAEVNKKVKKASREKKPKNKKKKSKIGKIIKTLILLLFLIVIIGSGIAVGIFWKMFGNELTIDKSDLAIKYENSTVYDSDKNLIATLSGGTKRKCISLSEMGEYLPKAYVAIEDERFYEHRGVDIKRTAAATFTYITHKGESSFGGSSITQQLVKNITNDKEDSNMAGVVRKIKEMSKAVQVEQYLSKDQILELYLNMIFIGGNDINGVELGAKYYFNKEPKDLSIAECAFMAGINNSPNAYKPFAEDPEGKNKKKINDRTKTVLSKMLELGYISQEQYDPAIAEVDAGLAFNNGDTSPTIEVSYVVEAALNQIMDQLVNEKGMSEAYAETYLYSSGLKIYTTQNTAIQAKVEEVLKDPAYYTHVTTKDKNGEKIEQNSMPTMVVIDHTTGNVVASATVMGEKDARSTSTKLGYLNIPTKLRKQTGSSMKPISVVAPGLESGKINAATVYIDGKTTFGGNYTPKNYYQGFKGPMTIRQAIEISANIPHVKALATIGLDKSVEFCKSVGLPEFKDEGLSLALGGLSKGVTVTEMAGAYSAIANGGNYIEPTFYKYVTDGDDNVVIEPTQNINRVMTEQNAYIEKSILKEPVVGSNGTAKYCAIDGMDVAAKTGTTNEDYDRWLCGFTPYYTAVCWYGYETNAPVKFNGNPAGKIWDDVMTAIHEPLEKKEFTKPEKIIEVEICKKTGLKARAGCGETYKEVFAKDSEPEECDGHTMAMICTQTNLLAAEGCPYGEYRYFGSIPPNERDATWSTEGYSSKGSTAPTEHCPHNGGVDPDWLARQKQAEAEAAAFQARVEAEAANQPSAPSAPAAPVETVPSTPTESTAPVAPTTPAEPATPSAPATPAAPAEAAPTTP